MTTQIKFHFRPPMKDFLDADPLDPNQQIDTILNGRWKLDRILGEGSFAVVFLATDLLSLGQTVAVKCLYKTGLSKAQILLQFDELLILRVISNHPNITTLLDHYESQDHLFLVIEYAELDLFESIMISVYPEKLALKLFSELVSAVGYCHAHSIYHRDLKPENCLISTLKNPSIRLSDFGLSTKDPLSTEYGCGSVRYMSSECLGLNNQSPYLSASNDVWALAIILINLLTGKNPWVSPDDSDRHFRAHMGRQHGIDSFQAQFNFSDEFCRVLRMVFCSSSTDRPSPQKFLDRVLSLQSIFNPSESSSRSTIPISPCSLSGFAAMHAVPSAAKTAAVISHLPPTPPSNIWHPVDAGYAPALVDESDHQQSSDSDHLMIFDFCMHDP